MKCWICYENILDYYYLLPDNETEYTSNKTLPKCNVYKIIHFDNISFLYYTMCLDCFTTYLDNYPFNINSIYKRQIMGKST